MIYPETTWTVIEAIPGAVPMPYDLSCTELDVASALEAGRPFLAAPGHLARPMMDVLLVEDDALVRECLGEALGDAGWRVSEAAGAAEALDLMTTDGMPGVLVADMALGRGMSGLALIAAARLHWPGVRAVLVSGTDMAEPALDTGDRFLRKPFDVDILTRAVSELAARQGTAGLDHAIP